jgi:VWFA-related protein
VLSVTVRDGNDNLVSGLEQQDFKVLDDGVEQKIVAFAAEGLPLSLVILVDEDMKWKEGTQVAESLRAIAGGLSATDEAMVCRYDMLFYPGQAFMNVTGDLIDELKATQTAAKPSPPYIPPPTITDRSTTTGPPPLPAPAYAGSRPSKAMDDALYSAAALLKNRPGDRRRVILIVSDGGDEPQLNHHTQEEVTELLLKENVSVYTLAAGTGPAKKFSALAEYATTTGGDTFYATKSREMEDMYPRIMEQARHDYTIAYAPAGNNKSASFHTIKVTAPAGLTANTRKGYYSRDSGNPQN